MIHRWLLTIGTAVCLSGAYLLYAAALRPLFPEPGVQPIPQIAVPGDLPLRPQENVRIATTYLGQQPWAADARYLLRSQQAFLYTDDWHPEGKEGRIRLRPFAMAWVSINKQTGKEEAVTVVSESALLKFSGSLDLSNPDPGRVIYAVLEGRTRIEGPEGLMIDGKHFVFSEASARLWSDQPVRCEYAGNSASANGLQADLIPQEGPPGKDRPHIFGVRTLQLQRNVVMNLVMQQPDEPLAVTVKCAGAFEYNIPQHTATFNDDVESYRQTGPDEFDALRSDRMIVLFGETEPSGAVSPPPQPLRTRAPTYQQVNGKLFFRRLQADSLPPAPGSSSGKQVRLFSTGNDLQARMRQLVYDGEQKLLVLRDSKGVDVQRAASRLHSPEIVLQFGDQNQLTNTWCAGPGWISHRHPETQDVLFAADWKHHLQQSPDSGSGLDLLELAEAASFRQPGAGTALGAEWIRVWLTPWDNPGGFLQSSPKARPKTSTPLTASTSADVKSKTKTTTIPDVQPRRIEADRHVVLVSPQLEAQCQHLEAVLDVTRPPRPGRPNTSLTGMLSRSPKTTAAADDGAGRARVADLPPEQHPLVVAADRIHVTLWPTMGKQPELDTVVTDGHVAIHQQRGEGQTPLAIKGQHVDLKNDGEQRQVVQITGLPATVVEDGFDLEAPTIRLDRDANRLWADGKGELKLPIKNDLDGKPLPDAQRLIIRWKAQMAFDGRDASFVDNVEAFLGDRQMKCERMKVGLTERLSFTAQRTNTAEVQLATVDCYDKVLFDNLTRADNKVVEIQQARVWELHVNRATGELTAQGPGDMEMWRRSQSTRGILSPQQSVKANSPMKVDTSEWEYTKVKFDGTMMGNLLRRYSTFRDRVEIVHGPVKQPHEIVHRDRLRKGCGFLKCQELQVMQAVADGDDHSFIQLLGRGDADLEGEGFFARADEIIYDQARGAYTLRGVGKNEARIVRQASPGAKQEPLTSQNIEFNPATKTVRAVGISGVEGSR